MPADNTFVLEDGDVLEITSQGAEVVDRVTAGPVYVDGRRVWDMTNGVMRDRRLLSKDGIVVLVLSQDGKTGQLTSPPDMVSSGFIDAEEHSATVSAMTHGGDGSAEQRR